MSTKIIASLIACLLFLSSLVGFFWGHTKLRLAEIRQQPETEFALHWVKVEAMNELGEPARTAELKAKLDQLKDQALQVNLGNELLAVRNLLTIRIELEQIRAAILEELSTIEVEDQASRYRELNRQLYALSKRWETIVQQQLSA